MLEMLILFFVKFSGASTILIYQILMCNLLSLSCNKDLEILFGVFLRIHHSAFSL
jgi:hypothetical protein